MSVEIRITDPANTPPQELKNVIRFLSSYLGEEYGPTSTVEIRMDAATLLKHAEQIAIEDNPAAGADPNQVFGGNGAPAIAGAGPSSTAPAAPPDTLTPPTAPFPPAAPPAPPAAAVAPPTVSPAGGVDVDSEGFPWDGRIHSSSKDKIANGTWKKRRGVDDAVVAQVRGELRAMMAIPAPAVGGVFPLGTPSAPVPNAPPNPTSSIVSPPVSVGASATIAAPAVPIPPAPSTGTITFPLLCQKITAAITSGALTQAQVQGVLNQYGVPSLPALAARLDLVPPIAATFGFSA